MSVIYESLRNLKHDELQAAGHPVGQASRQAAPPHRLAVNAGWVIATLAVAAVATWAAFFGATRGDVESSAPLLTEAAADTPEKAAYPNAAASAASTGAAKGESRVVQPVKKAGPATLAPVHKVAMAKPVPAKQAPPQLVAVPTVQPVSKQAAEPAARPVPAVMAPAAAPVPQPAASNQAITHSAPVKTSDDRGRVAGLTARFRAAVSRGDEPGSAALLSELSAIRGAGTAYILKLQAYRHMAFNQLAAAEDVLVGLLAQQPNDTGAAINLAIIEANTGRIGAARARAETLVSRYPDDSRVRRLINQLR